jgi:hypothetical protein
MKVHLVCPQFIVITKILGTVPDIVYALWDGNPFPRSPFLGMFQEVLGIGREQWVVSKDVLDVR